MALKSLSLPFVSSLNGTVIETKNVFYLTISDTQSDVSSSRKHTLGPRKLQWKQDTKKRVLLKMLRIMNGQSYILINVQRDATICSLYFI